MITCEVRQNQTISEVDRAGDSLVAPLPDWYAVHVKSRHEFIAADDLARKGIETYLPTMNRLSQWKDRKKLIARPLFPGYVFVRVPRYPGAFLEVLKTRGVVAFVSLEPATPAKISADEIDSLIS